MKRQFAAYLFIATAIVACRPDPVALEPELRDFPLFIEAPNGFPALAWPDDNLPTRLRVELGKRLFFDERMSRTGTVSCGSCHQPAEAFADDSPVSVGVEGRLGFRNAPTLTNVAWQPNLFMDGGVPTLEMQILAPFDNHDEFAFPITQAAELLRGDEEITELSLAAYNREPDAFVITRSIAAFERTLISANSRYDAYMRGDAYALSSDEVAGMEIFMRTETACASCHVPPLFTNFDFVNIGLYENYDDIGRMRVTDDPADNGRFKVPTLRNVGVTNPYMHDGSMSTLEEVIAHFNSGGADHPNKHPSIQPLNLSATEQQQLVAFLHALTDDFFITNPEHRP